MMQTEEEKRRDLYNMVEWKWNYSVSCFIAESYEFLFDSQSYDRH